MSAKPETQRVQAAGEVQEVQVDGHWVQVVASVE